MTPAERKALERERRQEAGLVRLEIYVHPDVREKVRVYAERQTRLAAKAALVGKLDD